MLWPNPESHRSLGRGCVPKRSEHDPSGHHIGASATPVVSTVSGNSWNARGWLSASGQQSVKWVGARVAALKGQVDDLGFNRGFQNRVTHLQGACHTF